MMTPTEAKDLIAGDVVDDGGDIMVLIGSEVKQVGNGELLEVHFRDNQGDYHFQVPLSAIYSLIGG